MNPGRRYPVLFPLLLAPVAPGAAAEATAAPGAVKVDPAPGQFREEPDQRFSGDVPWMFP